MALVIGYTVIVTRRHRGLESAYINFVKQLVHVTLQFLFSLLNSNPHL